MERKVTLYVVLCSLALHIPLVQGFTVHTTNRFVVKVAKKDFRDVKDELLQHKGVVFLKKIIPEYYLFEDQEYDRQPDKIAKTIAENDILKEKVQHFERDRIYTIEPDEGPIAADAVSADSQVSVTTIKHCPTFSDMGVESVWDMGFTGKGVVIAITDVGINTAISDLTPNIRLDLSHNYVTSSDDITPEMCLFYSDHGNNCAGVVGALKNDKCGDGIAFNASIVGVKLFKVVEHPRLYTCRITFNWTWLAQGLLHAVDEVDIYSNSWGFNMDFVSHSQLINDVFNEGVLKGRSGKGAIYVFPVGNISDPFTNSLHTIAVNSVDRAGQASTFSAICACTLTSAYGEPSDDRTKALLTTSYGSNVRMCKSNFKGTSASTAIVAGIIGLALQANPQLTWRDIQNIVVDASDSTHLPEYKHFHTNGAGKKYHAVLGFGLLNATTLVKLAKDNPGLPKQLVMKGVCASTVKRFLFQSLVYEEARVDIVCDAQCVNRTESVLVIISYETASEYFTELILWSPSGTKSHLMNRKQSQMREWTTRTNVVFKSVNFWGETAAGPWIIVMSQNNVQSKFSLLSCDLAVYGTGYSIHDMEKDSETIAHYVEATTQPASQMSSLAHQSKQLEKHSNSHSNVIYVIIVASIGVLIVLVIAFLILLFLYKKNHPTAIHVITHMINAITHMRDCITREWDTLTHRYATLVDLIS